MKQKSAPFSQHGMKAHCPISNETIRGTKFHTLTSFKCQLFLD